MASSRPALLERVAAAQTDMTERLANEFRAAQEKGYVRSDFPARTGALFIQSYTIGRALLDVEPHSRKDETDWGQSHRSGHGAGIAALTERISRP